MADVEYRVKLDTSDLSSQLQQIRAQIDQALAVQTFNNVIPSPQPSFFAYPVPNILGNAGNMAGTAATGFGYGADAAFSQAATLSNATRLGFQKFNNDVQTALLSQTAQTYSPNVANFPNFQNMSVPGLLVAGAGFGYDPRMSITPGRFADMARENLGYSSIQTLTNVAGAALGTAVGTALGGPGLGSVIGGIAGGFAGGFAYDAAAVTILRDFEQSNSIQQFARGTSFRFLSGRFSLGEARQVGNALAGFQRDRSLVGYDISGGDVQRLVQEFTEVGGFDTVNSAQEYQTRAKEMIQRVRQVMHVLQISEKDALRAIKDFKDLDVGNAFGVGLGVAGQAYRSGYTGGEMMQFGMQAAEIVRGTGISMGSAFIGGIDALARIKDGMRSDSIPLHLVHQLGGAENTALTVQRLGYEWANSTSGFTQFAAGAAVGGLSNTIGMGPYKTLATASQYLTKGGVGGYLEFLGGQSERISQYSSSQLMGMNALQWFDEIRLMPGIPHTRNAFRGYLQTRGIPDVTAQLYYDTVMGPHNSASKLLSEMLLQAKNEIPTTLQTLSDRATNAVMNTILDIPLAQIPGVASFTIRDANKAATSINDSITNALVRNDEVGLRQIGIATRAAHDPEYMKYNAILVESKKALTAGHITPAIKKLLLASDSTDDWTKYYREVAQREQMAEKGLKNTGNADDLLLVPVEYKARTFGDKTLENFVNLWSDVFGFTMGGSQGGKVGKNVAYNWLVRPRQEAAREAIEMIQESVPLAIAKENDAALTLVRGNLIRSGFKGLTDNDAWDKMKTDATTAIPIQQLTALQLISTNTAELVRLYGGRQG